MAEQRFQRQSLERQQTPDRPLVVSASRVEQPLHMTYTVGIVQPDQLPESQCLLLLLQMIALTEPVC